MRQMTQTRGNIVQAFLKINPEDTGMATVHIFRFEGGKIIEQWGTHQSLPENVVHEYREF